MDVPHDRWGRRIRRVPVWLGLFIPLGCWNLQPPAGGGQVTFHPPRRVVADDVAVPAGYRIEAVATGLTYPTATAVDDQGRLHVIEAGYSYGEDWGAPRLLRIEPDGRQTVIATGDNPPWTGISHHQGAFYVSEGGQAKGGRISRIMPDGTITPLVSGLPGLGDHHTDRPVISPDGWLYFSQGTATNSGIVGPDNAEFGWLARHPAFHDIPCQDVTLAGVNVTTANPLVSDAAARVTTGAYVPFGTVTSPGQVIKGSLPCSGAVLRLPLAGGPLELVAWGFRNPYGLAFAPDGRLFATDNGFDQRGSRPVFGAGDLFWHVQQGNWYGWPDYAGVQAVDDPSLSPTQTPQAKRLLASPPSAPSRPAAVLGVHSSSNGFDFSRSAAFGYPGEAFVAQFGDLSPKVGKVAAPVGFRVVRVHPDTGVIESFAVNKGRINGPATRLGSGGLERPVDARFDPTGNALYVADFGVMTVSERGPQPHKQTGVIWRISRTGGATP